MTLAVTSALVQSFTHLSSSQPLSSTNFLHELDKAILSAQKTSVPGDVIMLPRILNMLELRRLRQQFISYTKLHPNENISQLANMFVQYLNQSLR
ncbi:hypothetical protein GDO78_023062 [Eleutherodactylus coqui]|uniref:Protein KTI12 homolog n=1 Tax=Eleutherodactylus coqui TaxID=57060 RepID=A0A8J6BM73_ELECQ|nr:hypothetical protein GDO78_023062 [Eleutherodactylus coqui]